MTHRRLPRAAVPLALSAAVAVAAVALGVPRSTAAGMRPIPAPILDEPTSATRGREVAIVAGGCFWGVQGVFQHVKGVSSAVSGYAGGAAETARYPRVSMGDTGHAEAVRITFDPQRISYGRILQIYFSAAHDPTELNRQGPDTGRQYRSAIFPTSDEQARVASVYKVQLDRAHAFSAPLVTTIESGSSFYPAEEHHQNYLTLNPRSPYIAYNDLPKVEAVKRMFPDLYRDDPVLVVTSLTPSD